MAFLQSGGSVVSSSNIVDGTIVNADIAATAEIETSKLAGANADGSNDTILPVTVIKNEIITVTPAEMQALALQSGKTLIAAPGAGKIIILDDILFNMQYNSIAYANGSGIGCYYAGNPTNIFVNSIPVGTVNTAGNTLYTIQNVTDRALTGLSNLAVTLGLVGVTAFTAGNSTVQIHVRYRIVTL